MSFGSLIVPTAVEIVPSPTYYAGIWASFHVYLHLPFKFPTTSQFESKLTLGNCEGDSVTVSSSLKSSEDPLWRVWEAKMSA